MGTGGETQPAGRLLGAGGEAEPVEGRAGPRAQVSDSLVRAHAAP